MPHGLCLRMGIPLCNDAESICLRLESLAATKEIRRILLICANVLTMHLVISGNVFVAIRQAA
jgi:hypothetical protein